RLPDAALMSVFSRTHMPPFTGAAAWVNSEPLTPEGLQGKAVLVDFWTLTCINWLRTEPYIRAWSNAYRDDRLVGIGVHTPDFSCEPDCAPIRKHVSERDIDSPVAVDNDYAIWPAFDNHYWPAEYFIDREGIIRDTHFGEGRYEQSERRIQELLGIDREPVSVEGMGDEAEADWDHLSTPETYLGWGRGERSDDWALKGRWSTEQEAVVLDEAGGSISFGFHARDAHLVMSPGESGPIPFRVLLDGQPPGPSHGVHTD